ncbi:hypothetical protein [Pseudomonas donghuensis]|uniref:hypothetical protein n=1 Tax=Pseudomonas donghuensis TaxID=1163398 RepID=UPI002E13E62D|nr:hypothetical protein VP780_03310 [Pseudomonas donghuensis]
MKTDFNFSRQHLLLGCSAFFAAAFFFYSIATINYWIDGSDLAFFSLLTLLSVTALFNMICGKEIATSLSLEEGKVHYFDGKQYRVAVPVEEITEVKVQNLLLCNRLIVDFSGARRLSRFNVENAEAFRDQLQSSAA